MRSIVPIITLASLFNLAFLVRADRNEPQAFPLAPISGADGAFEVGKVDGERAWRGLKNERGRYSPYMYFRVPDDLTTNRGTVYVKVEYRDLGVGRLSLQYNARGPGGDYRPAEVGHGRFLTDSGQVHSAVFQLDEPDFRHAQNLGADLRLGHPDGLAPLHVLRVTLHLRPTAHFLRETARPWLEPYRGPRLAEIDATTLRRKVLCGYQGWFRCPGDGTESGWAHWSRDPARINARTLNVEMWPEMNDVPDSEAYPAPGFTRPDGQPARLFSSADPGTVDRHFDWMREAGIDGVFVQRFVVGLDDPAESARVLGLARNAANRTGRVFAVEYDMTGTPPDQILDRLNRDWRWLVDVMKITADPRYLHHDGKPVLAIFGFYPDRFEARLAHRIIDAFQAEGNYRVTLVGGCPWSWRSEPDAGWARAYRRFDVVKPWNVGNVAVRDGRQLASTGSWKQDRDETRRVGRLFLPVIYPGFSWNNMKGKPPGTTTISRLGGAFYWDQFATVGKLGIDMAFVAMFDELDEGTAIFKVTNRPPAQGHFLTFDGLPADWYLRLTGEGSRLIRAERPISTSIPITP